MSTPKTLTLDPDQIRHHAKLLANHKNELEAILATIQNEVDTLVDGGAFNSKAGFSARDTQTQWNKSVVRTVDLLDEFGHHLTGAADAFEAVDDNYTLKGTH